MIHGGRLEGPEHGGDSGQSAPELRNKKLTERAGVPSTSQILEKDVIQWKSDV